MTSNKAAPLPGRMTEAEFRGLYDRLRGEVPWGPDDRRGALNHLGPAQIQAAAGEVGLGRTVSLAAPVENQVSADNPDPAQHRMVQAPGAAGDGLEFAADRIAMNIHGNADSHIDALCHVAFDGTLYNGVPASAVTSSGAVELSIAVAASGIAGRGVLLDVPRSRGVPWLEPGDHVTLGDIAAAEEGQGVRIGQGDILLVRVGHRRRRKECGRPCQTCANDCEVRAIRPTGEINANECHYCLDCQVTYYNDRRCMPLIERRERREARSGRPAIPIKPVP